MKTSQLGKGNNIISGNEAIAAGAIASGVKVATGYPGAPCTEVLETIAYLNKSHFNNEVSCQWSINEKVALEVAIGSSFSGSRTMVLMKTLGLNVAADPFMQLAGTQINGGIVLVVADDVGRVVGDDYEDCRAYAIAASIPILEPTDSKECFYYMQEAFDISEKFSTPVIVRLNSITSRSKSLLKLREPLLFGDFKSNDKYAFSGIKTFANIIQFCFGGKENNPKYEDYYVDFNKKWNELKKIADDTNLNQIEYGTKDLGFICTGVSYHYTKEVFPKASYLKLGLGYPLPENKLKEFCENIDSVVVIEETHPILEKEVKALGLQIHGSDIIPRYPKTLYLTPEYIKECINRSILKKQIDYNTKPYVVPRRATSNCPGCPHLFIYQAVKKLHLKVASGIGCCAIGAYPNIGVVDIIKCMGAPTGIAQGYELGMKLDNKEEMIAIMGDGEFWHSGIMGIINSKVNQLKSTTVIMDNGVVAMTGGQAHPSSGFDIYRKPTKGVSIEETCKALGLEYVKIVNPYNFKELTELIREAVSTEETTVIIARHGCMRSSKANTTKKGFVSESCNGCRKCQQIGCLAISESEGKAVIDQLLCKGCGLCTYICPSGLIDIREV